MKPALLWLIPIVAGGIAFFASARVVPEPVAKNPAAHRSTSALAKAAPGSDESRTDKAGASSTREPARRPLAAYDPQRFTDAHSRGGRASRVTAFADLLDTLPPSGFPRVLEQVMRLSADDRDPLYLHLLFQSWQRADREGAIAGLAAIPESSSRNEAAMVMARAWARADVATARAWAEKNLQQPALMGFQGYADQLEGKVQAPKSSIEEILKNPDRSARSGEISAFIRARAKEAPLAAANLLKSIPDERERKRAAFSLALAWKDQDAMAAARWFLSPEARQLGVSEDGFGQLVDSLAQQNPVGSLELLRSVDLSEGFTRLHVQQLLSKVYDKDPQAVLTLLQDPQFDRPDFPERYRVLAKHDPELAFKDAIEKFRAETDRANRFHRRNGALLVVEEVARKEPAQAAALAVTAPAEIYPHLFGKIGGTWIKTDAAAAAAWAAKLPPGQARDDASREFVFHWGKTDSTRAAAWLDTIPKGSTRDEAIFGFACATMDLDPDAALAWTRSITKTERREFVLARAWQIWARENTSAAESWLEKEPSLTEEQREKIRSQE